MYYIRNKDPYFSSHGNINTNKRICLSSIFNNKRTNKGRWKRNNAIARRATEIPSSSTLYKSDQQTVSET